MSIRILLADDQKLVRAGFRSLLERTEDMEVVGEAADGAEAVKLARDLQPDVVLMDIRMPVMDGLEALGEILSAAQRAGVKVVMLTTFELDEYLFEALRLGASGFLLKDIEPDDLRQAIRVVHAGNALLSPSVTRRVIDQFAARPENPPVESDRMRFLTEREKEVVGLVGAGLSNDEIAARLFLSPATAKTHVSRSMIKLGVRDRAQLVVFAYETGLVSRGQSIPPAR
ncbi:MAG TPA: response regulator transcription factor [Actinomycetota bacterium]|nr:response regulator transcription factor [Actinomycetota bacterium]